MKKLFTLLLLSLCAVQFANAQQRNPIKEWATYYFNSETMINDVATDKQGNVYVTGYTLSGSTFYDYTASDFLVSPYMATPGSFQDTFAQDPANPAFYIFDVPNDAFLAKFSPKGVLLWCTYYGGYDYDYGQAVACDADDNVYMAGFTASTNGIASVGSHQATGDPTGDAFLVKFNSAGQRQWATYYGGTGMDYAYVLAVDKDNNVYMGGNTQSPNNISSTGAFKTTFSGGKAATNDAFIVKFNSAGVRQWGTYYGDTLDERLSSLVCDAEGNVYAAGQTSSIVNIATANSHQPTAGGGTPAASWDTFTDAFMVKLDGTGQRKWATYYGGSRKETFVRIAYDKQGNNIYLGGTTSSSNNIATTGAYQTQNFTTGDNEYDAFLAKFSVDGVRQWGTYYGGANGMVWGSGNSGLSCDPVGNVYISHTAINAVGIATSGSYQDTLGGSLDMCLAKFNTKGERLWGTYYGSTNSDYTICHTSDALGNTYLIGWSSSKEGIATQDGFQDSIDEYPMTPTSVGGITPVIAKFRDCIPVTNLSVSGNTAICAGDSLKLNVFDKTAQTYQWQKDGVNVAGATDTVLTVKTAGAYRVIAGNGVGCVDTSDATIVKVNPLPVPVIDANGNILSTTIFKTYQWNKGGQSIAGATNATYTATENAVYTVTVTDSNGCAATSAPITTTVGKVVFNNAIKVYPNPVVDILHVNSTITVDAAIYDVVGKLMLQQSNAKQLDVRNFAAGLYIIKITDAVGNLLQAERFVKAVK